MVLEALTTRRAIERDPEAVAIGSLFLLMFGTYAWAILVARAGYSPLSPLVASNEVQVFVLPAFLIQITGLAFAASVYARVRNVEIPFGLPARNRLPIAAGTVATPVLLVAVAAVLGHSLFDASVSAAVGHRYSPRAPLATVAIGSVPPALLRGVGYGLLFFGVAHERLRAVTTPRHAVVLTPLVVGFFWQVHTALVHVVRFDSFATTNVALAVLVGVAFGASLGLLYRGTVRAPVEHLLRARYVPVFTLGLLGVAGVVLPLADVSDSAFDILRLSVFVVATYGYERTRSIWVPILAVAAFPAALDFARYLEAVWHVVPAA